MKKNIITKTNIRNLSYSIEMINLFGILIEPNWVDRLCNIQDNWYQKFRFVELTLFKNIELYILINENCFYINIQDYEGVQLNKSNFNEINLPPNFYNFIIDEPIVSLGTTNLIWGTIDHPISQWIQLNKHEYCFINSFINDYATSTVLDFIKLHYNYNFSELQFKKIVQIIYDKTVTIESINEILGISISKLQFKELLNLKTYNI